MDVPFWHKKTLIKKILKNVILTWRQIGKRWG